MSGSGNSRRMVVAIAVTVGLLAGACGSSKGGQSSSTVDNNGAAADGGTPVDGGSVVLGVASETSGWNPHRNQWAPTGSLVASSVLEPLATMGENNGAKPWLATSWIANETFDRWQISLRTDVTFQNGEPFNAAAAKANIDDAANGPLSGAALKELFKQVDIVDDHTVLVQLTQPWAAFPSSFLDGQSAMMMAPSTLTSSDHGEAHPIGTGPFTFASWEPGAAFRTVKNPNYWQKGLPHLDSLEFRVLSDNASRAAALQTGDINMMMTIDAPTATKLEGSYTEIKDWATEPGSIILNTAATANGKPNPLNNIHARRALAYATDRQAVAASQGDGVLSPSSPFSPNNPWGLPEDQNNYPAFDPAKAAEEVAAYKADTGASSLDFSLSGVPDVDTVKLLQIVQSQWETAGIHAHIESVEAANYITQVVAGNFNAALFQVYSSPDPDQNHYFWSKDTIQGPGGVNINFNQYSTPEIEQDLVTGRQSGFPDQRKQAYHDLVRRRNDAVADIWVYWTPYTLIADSKVHGFETPQKIAWANFQPKTWLGELWRQ
jgi:ABC-type transport system substrate-binding protein